MAPLSHPEGQLSSAAAVGKMLGQRALPAPPPTRPPTARDRRARLQASHGVQTGAWAPRQPQQPAPAGAAPWQVPMSQCQDWALVGLGGTGARSSREKRGFGCSQESQAALGPRGAHVWCWVDLCTVLGASRMPQRGRGAPLRALGRGQAQAAAAVLLLEVCAHREDDPEVVEQLDVLGDARAGPADHVALAARGRGGMKSLGEGGLVLAEKSQSSACPGTAGSHQAEAGASSP